MSNFSHSLDKTLLSSAYLFMGKFGKFAHKQPLFFVSSQPGKSLIFWSHQLPAPQPFFTNRHASPRIQIKIQSAASEANRTTAQNERQTSKK